MRNPYCTTLDGLLSHSLLVGNDRLGGVGGVVVLAAELLEGLAGSLGDEEGGEATEKHEESVDLEHVVHPGSGVVLGSAASAESSDGTLADDGADLAGGGRDTVGGGTVSGGEDLTGDNESGGVGAWSSQYSSE